MSRGQKTRSDTAERTLRLVSSAADSGADAASDAELGDIKQLIRAAAAPTEIEPEDNEVLIALALGAELELSSAAARDERKQAEQLRDALAGGADHPLADLAVSLRAAAAAGGELDELTNERLLRRALQHLTRDSSPLDSPWRRRAWVAGVVAIAAGVALLVGSRSLIDPLLQDPSVTSAALIKTRSTQELFDPLQPFPAKGGETERADKIVQHRTADLRANRFAQWGAR